MNKVYKNLCVVYTGSQFQNDYDDLLELGNVYTIDEVFTSYCNNIKVPDRISLKEIDKDKPIEEKTQFPLYLFEILEDDTKLRLIRIEAKLDALLRKLNG